MSTPPTHKLPTTILTTRQNAEEAAELKKKRTFRKFSYRGIDLDQYVQSSNRIPKPSSPSQATLLTTQSMQTPRPSVQRTPQHPSRPRPPPIQPRSQTPTHGPNQKTPQSQTRSQTKREARPGQNPLAQYDYRAGNDWIGSWHLLRQGIQSGGDQTGDGGTLLGRVQYQLQACQAW